MSLAQKKEASTVHAVRGKNLTGTFFEKLHKYQGAQSSSFYSKKGDDQGQHLVQKEQAIMRHYQKANSLIEGQSSVIQSDMVDYQCLIPMASSIQEKIEETQSDQNKLRQIQRDEKAQMLFASAARGGIEQQVQGYTMQIKDSITQIEKGSDQLKRLIGSNLRMPSAQHDHCCKAASEIIEVRCFGLVNQFQNSLQEHQKTIQKQEAKKERLMGGNPRSNGYRQGSSMQFGKPPSNGKEDEQLGLNRSQTVGGVTNRSRANKKSRINIMPSSKFQDGIDFNELTGGNGGDSRDHGSSEAMIMQTMDPQHANRSVAINQIENALRDISSLFQKFGTIVQQHEKLVERIDENAEQALYDIEGAKKEIREIYENTSNNRTLIMKVFFILLIFCTFYILFVL